MIKEIKIGKLPLSLYLTKDLLSISNKNIELTAVRPARAEKLNVATIVAIGLLLSDKCHGEM